MSWTTGNTKRGSFVFRNLKHTLSHPPQTRNQETAKCLLPLRQIPSKARWPESIGISLASSSLEPCIEMLQRYTHLWAFGSWYIPILFTPTSQLFLSKSCTWQISYASQLQQALLNKDRTSSPEGKDNEFLMPIDVSNTHLQQVHWWGCSLCIL